MLKKIKKDLKYNGQVYIKIKVLPNASKTIFGEVVHDDMIKMMVAAIPEKGKANKEVIRFLSKEFKVTKQNIKIISGAGSRVKLLKITL